jgi:hypothetical protein
MKRNLSTSVAYLIFASLFALLFVVGGCSKDAVTDSIAVQYEKIDVWTESPSPQSKFVRAKITVKIINRTEKSLKVGALEGAIFSPKTNTSLARFRPIIPEAYGTMSEIDLLPKQTKDFIIETPPDLKGFDLSADPQVIVKISFTTTDGFRTEAISAEVPVANR